MSIALAIGIIYDDGGATGSYSTNCQSTLVLLPNVTGQYVTISGTSITERLTSKIPIAGIDTISPSLTCSLTHWLANVINCLRFDTSAFVRSVEDLESPVTFRDGNDIYLRFSSPVAGSLCVYLVDEDQNAFCLLPYANQQSGAQAIEANKDYVFFYEKFDKNADEYVLTCERSMEQNALYVVFSPNTFTKANDTQSVTNWRDQPMPRQLSYADLLKWLARNQAKDEAMVVRTSVISIRR